MYAISSSKFSLFLVIRIPNELEVVFMQSFKICPLYAEVKVIIFAPLCKAGNMELTVGEFMIFSL